MNIQEIVDFRNSNKEYVSTSHTCEIKELAGLLEDLTSEFTEFTIQVKGTLVKITIPR